MSLQNIYTWRDNNVLPFSSRFSKNLESQVIQVVREREGWPYPDLKAMSCGVQFTAKLPKSNKSYMTATCQTHI